METYPVYCAACGGREAFVSSSDLLICTGCGEGVTLRGEPVERRRTEDARKWQGGPWAVEGLSHEERCETLHRYVQEEHAVILPDDIVSVLAHTHSRAEVEFLLPILMTSGWRVTGSRRLANGHLRISVQESVEGYIIPFLFEDLLSGRRYVVEMDGPKHARAKLRKHDSPRDKVLRQQRYRVVRIGILDARKTGLSFRKDLENARRTEMPRTRVIPAAPVKAEHQRVWSTNELAYGVHGLPYARRLEVLKDWQRARKVSLPEDVVEILAYCDYAGEVLFAEEILKIPVWKRTGEKRVECSRYALNVQHIVESYQVDFCLEFRDRVEVVEINPATHHPFDWQGARKQDAALASAGVKVLRVSAKEAKQTGRTYATDLLSLLPGVAGSLSS